jgi:SnoaL-like polyketide cyclase
MSVDDNKAIIRAFVETVWNGRQLDRAGEVVAADFVDHAPMPGQAPGLEGVKRKWAMYLDAIPDFRITIEDLGQKGTKLQYAVPTKAPTEGGRCWAYRPLASGSSLAASVFFG